VKAIGDDEISAWLRNAESSRAMVDDSVIDLGGEFSFGIPVDAGRRTHLARLLASAFHDAAEGLLWIDEYGIWPSSENRTIFTALRRAFDETRALREAPGHVFSPEDSELLQALIAIVLYFSWGARLFRNDGMLRIRISHDEYVECEGNSGVVAALKNCLATQGYEVSR